MSTTTNEMDQLREVERWMGVYHARYPDEARDQVSINYLRTDPLHIGEVCREAVKQGRRVKVSAIEGQYDGETIELV